MVRTWLLSALVSCDREAGPPLASDVVLAEQPLPEASSSPAHLWPPFEQAPAESPRLPAPPEASAGLDAVERKLAITLDRPLYRPGETLWARIWDLAPGQASAGREDIAVELRDPRGILVHAALYRNEGAGASVALDLDPSLAGGPYALVARAGGRQVERPLVVASFEEPRIRKELTLLRDAYGPGDEVSASLELASAGRGPLAHHPVKVVVQVEGQALPVFEATTDERGEATLRFSLPQIMRRPDAVLSVMVEEEGWTESITRPIPVVLDQVQLEWFPEGGDLVSGLPSRVYLRARDAHGEPADAAGVIMDDRGEEVARFRTLHDGLARFELTPEPGRRYQARLTEPKGIDQAPVWLPEARPDGCVLRTYDDLDGQQPAIRVGVRCSTERQVVLAGEHDGLMLIPAALRAGPKAPSVAYLSTGHLSRDLRQGVARVTLLSEDLEPLAERLIYRNRGRHLKVTLTPERTEHGPRDEVVLDVSTADPDGRPVQADLALSAVDDRLLKLADDQHGHLLSQLHLGPYAAGLDDPAWYFDPDEPDAGRGLDLLMGTAGWRRMVRVPLAFDPPAGEEAKKGEGEVAKKEAKIEKAKGSKIDARRLEIDRQLAESAGVLGAMEDSDLRQVLGASGLSSHLTQGIGGLIGTSGTQTGTGGLGLRGIGMGGGGTAEGLGGLGTRGMGSGASGYGSGGGNFGARGAGGVGTAGAPIILGALDRTLIDEVIQRHMNQIRYCYQRELVKNPALGGKIAIKFTIGRDGSVSAASTKSTTMNSASVENCIVGRFLRMQFPAPKGGGIVIVSYPFLFSPELSPGGGSGYVQARPQYRGSLEPVYAVVREYAQPDYRGAPVPAVRDDFRPTVAWQSSVRTDAHGKARVRFFLDDSVTTFRVTAEGVGAGHVGREELELHSTLPFSLDLPLPQEVSFGDRLLLPVRLSNRRSRPLQVALTTEVTAPLLPEDGTGTQQLTLQAGEGGSTVVPLRVPDIIGEARVTASASALSLSDKVERTLQIAPRGFPARWSSGGMLETSVTEQVTIADALPGGTEASLTLYTTPLSSLLEGLHSMVRIPHGCFEQTSSSNHPNVLVLRYLDRTGSAISLAVDRTEALSRGYSLLAGYQVSSGGFEPFGRGPGKVALSAYGLLQLTQMQEVYPVDRALLDRDAAFLLAARDGSGGYRTTGSSAHSYGAAPAELNDAYITFSLVETGRMSAPSPEIDRQRQLGRSSSDPYLLALAVLTLQHTHPAEAIGAAERLAALQDAQGRFPGAATSISVSGGRDLLVETTALAALALHRAHQRGDGDYRAATARAARFLVNSRQGSYGWGGTQATVLALEALSAISTAETREEGTVVVRIDGQQVGSVRYDGREQRGVTLDLSRWLTPGAHTLQLEQQGTRQPVPYALEATWRRDTPEDAAQAPLELAVSLANDLVAQGESVRLVATVRNRGETGVASPLARLGLPAGVRAEQWQLEALRTRGEVAYFETRPREVTLYWEAMAPGEERQIALDLVAEIPGTFHAPPSVVYPYYHTDAKRWAAGSTLTIRP